ncbi:MAG TPA: glycosyltransferase family 4 protein [Pirellulales bacterium]|nr:glycosyltransferase family 4 protein [Pirellulales bacterium]
MRIAFIDLIGWDYTPRTPEVSPLGGTQSAVCYLARHLAAAGCEVSLLNRAARAAPADGNSADGVSVVPLTSADYPRALAACDVAVMVSAAIDLAKLKAHLRPGVPLVLWTQHATDQSAVRPLAQSEVAALVDHFVFVSRWQQAGYQQEFGLPVGRCHILRNAVSPAFAGMFADGRSALAAKTWPPRLAYTSTPFRGLDILLEVFPAIRAEVPGTTLEVYSSMQVYKLAAGRDSAEYGHLYQRAAATEGVEYVGSLPQGELAEAMRGVALLAYPNTFAETSCIAVMEALAAGCRVVTSDWGALAETTAGFARLVPTGDVATYRRQFTRAVVGVLREQASDPAAAQQHLDRQLAHVEHECTWPRRAAQWIEWLATIV